VPRKERLIGYLRGEYANGLSTVISVYKAGAGYRLGGPGRPHLCHPSVRSIEAVKREAFHVYDLRNAEFDEI
jgi:hypothetical protein